MTMSRKLKLVLFDLGNVLVYIHPEAFLQTLGIDTPGNRQYYHPSVVEIVKRYERGDDGTEQYLDQLEVLLNGRGAPHNPAGKKFSRDELTRAMLTVIGQPVAGMEDLVRRVGQSAQVGLLSNTNPLHYEFCQSNFPVLRLIPLHLLSFQLRSLKPEPAIFERVLQRVRITAADILYIDDLEENLRAAEEAGFTSHLFRDRSQLQAVLRDLTLI